MARLPQPGGDSGNWGVILNEYLSQSLKSDGSLQDNVVTASSIADNAVTAATIEDGSITEAQLDAAVQTKLNATAGTPSWDDITDKPAVIATGATQADARSAIGAGTSSISLAGSGAAATAAKSDHTHAVADTTGLQTALDGKAAASHSHAQADIIGLATTLSGKQNVPTGTATGTKFLRDDNSWQSLPAGADASAATKGVVQLTGDLTGTAASPAIATGAITSAKIADGTIVGSDIAVAAGIVKTQLSAGVQASLDKADTALQSASASGNGSLSGFPLKKPGERSVAVAQEVGVAKAHDSDFAGRKIVVLAESWDQPGALKHIWVACDNSATTDGFLEQGAIIRIYTDVSGTPAVSMPLGDFFCLANRSDIFATPRVGRTERGSGGSAYRYLYMPFQKYLRVEIESSMVSDTAFYGVADYSIVSSFADFGSQQLAYSIHGQRVANHPRQTSLTLCDIDGGGQVESLVISYSGADSGDNGVLEGNVQIFIDNEPYPMWTSSGMEDAFNGGWYSMPVGGYPAGRAGNSDQSGSNVTMYRFFLDDPIFYTSHIKVVISAGQPYQGTVVSSTVKFAGYVGLWSNVPATPNYTAVDMGGTVIYDNQMSQAVGTLDSGVWYQDGSRTPVMATGSTFTIAYGSASADQDVRAAPIGVSLPSNYWLETRMRITDATHDEQQVALAMLGASPDPYFGSAVHIMLRRRHQTSWTVELRDDFSTPLLTYIGGGMDLTNMWVRVALCKQGGFVTGYYSFSDTSPTWIPIGRWEATKSGAGFGIGTWTAGAEFDYLTVRPLHTITS